MMAKAKPGNTMKKETIEDKLDEEKMEDAKGCKRG